MLNNLTIYQWPTTFELDIDRLPEQLEANPFTPCRPSEPNRSGFVPVAPGGELLVHTQTHYHMVAMTTEERILPSAVVKEAVEDRVAQIEMNEHRKVFRKERQQLKELVTEELTPKAFTKRRTTRGYFDTRNRLLIIEASSARKAEELINQLREAMGSLQVVPLAVGETPSVVMTRWVETQQLPQHFTLGQRCEFYNPVDTANKVRCSAQDLSTEEVTALIEAGKRVSKVQLNLDERLDFMIDEDLGLKGIKLSDEAKEAQDMGSDESPAQAFDQEMAMMTLEIDNLLNQLLPALGGREEH